MKSLALILVLALAGGGYWFWQQKTSGDDLQLNGTGQTAKSDAKSDDLTSGSTASKSDQAPDDMGADGTKGKADGLGPRDPSSPENQKPERPMSKAERDEVTKHWNDIARSLDHNAWINMTRENPDSFGDLPEPEEDAKALMQAWKGLVGSRIGMNDSKSTVSRVHGGLPFAERALRGVKMGVREGNVQFRITQDGYEGNGAAKADPHSKKMLHYKWRVGFRVIELSVNRITTAPEVLDLFDPKRFQG